MEPEEKPQEYKIQGAYTDDPGASLPENWPTSGEVEFRNVTIKYDPDGPEILKNINLKFAAGERVAVVGRTGSGKSTVSRVPQTSITQDCDKWASTTPIHLEHSRA